LLYVCSLPESLSTFTDVSQRSNAKVTTMPEMGDPAFADTPLAD
jgi:hypothetical protein